MKLSSASVEYARVLNLGDFNSLRVTCTLGAEFDQTDDEAAVMAALWEMARENVRAQIARVTDRAAARAEEVFLGLPKEIRQEMEVDRAD